MSTAIWACALVVLTSAVTDFATRKIPNIISLGGIVVGLAIHTATGAVDGFGGAARGLGFALLGLFTVSIAPFFFWKRGEMGGGDVKLLAAVGALVGPVIGFDVLAFTFAGSLLVLLPYRLIRHNALVVVARNARIGLVNLLRRNDGRIPYLAVPKLPPAILAPTISVAFALAVLEHGALR